MSSQKSAIAVTRKINPPGVEPKLNLEQIWKGLGIKARKPMSFVDQISECTVDVDTPEKVVRRVKLNGAQVTETIFIFEPTIVYFEASNGMRVTNMVSYDSDGELLMTYSFCNGVPGHGTIDDPIAVNEKLGDVVDHGIKRIRELVADRTIA